MRLLRWLRASILIVTTFLPLISLAEGCPDMRKLSQIGDELATAFKLDLCKKPIKLSKIEWLRINALPKLMNKAFLGVEPPPNWQGLADELIIGCYQTGDLCSEKVQSAFADCAMGKFPAIILQLSPWFADNCEQINQTLIQDWDSKKFLVMGLIAGFIKEI